MTLLDWVLLSIGVPAFFYAFAPEKWRFWKKNRSQEYPIVLPIKFRQDERGYEGLLLKNSGDIPVLDVVLDPLQMEDHTIRFTGAEVTYLEANATCFFPVAGISPAIVLKDLNSNSMVFNVLRGWQVSIGNKWDAEAEGRITFKDTAGHKYETTYRVGADIYSVNGLVVRFVSCVLIRENWNLYQRIMEYLKSRPQK